MRTRGFGVAAVPHRYPDKVQCDAVLFRIKGWPRKPNSVAKLNKRDRDRQIVAKTYELRELWQDRVDELGRAGWRYTDPASDRGRTNNEFASNCRPTFVIPKGATGFRREGMGRERFRSCNQIRVCPFCYARWVRKMWARFDYAIFRDPEAHRGDDEPESGKRTPQNREVDLVLYRRTLTVTEADLSPAATRLQKAIQAHLDNWSRLQDLSTSKSRAGVFSGGLRSIMIYPGKEADWEVQLRCLLTSPHGRFSDRDVQQNDRREDTECTAVRQLTRRQLVRETAWMLQYPPAMLTGSAAKTVLGLRADHYQSPAGRTRRQNMNSTFGVIRQVKAEMERLGLEGRQQGCCQLPITYRTCPSHSMLFART